MCGLSLVGCCCSFGCVYVVYVVCVGGLLFVCFVFVSVCKCAFGRACVCYCVYVSVDLGACCCCVVCDGVVLRVLFVSCLTVVCLCVVLLVV